MPSERLRATSFVSYLTNVDVAWRNNDYRGLNAVRLVKGEEVTRDLEIKFKGNQYKFNLANSSDFVERIVPMVMANYLDQEFEGKIALVPIPGSKTTRADSEEFRTLALAENIKRFSKLDCKVAPCLVFRRELEKARKGGPRDPQVLLPELRLLSRPSRPIVLVDDVCTSGGHFTAALWKLEENECTVVGAYAFGRSTKEQPDHVFEKHVVTLDCSRHLPDDDDF